jgi:hypothetical protein
MSEVTYDDTEAYHALMGDEQYDDPKAGGWHFARHRIASTAALQAELAEARARIAVLDQVAHNFRDMLEAHCDNTGEQLEPDDKALFDAWKATLAGKETP